MTAAILNEPTHETSETPLTGAILLAIMIAIVALNVQLILVHGHGGLHRPMPVVAAIAKPVAHFGAHG